jgi:diadenosine tetraphosphate (Ap4A) HIT family hydrolase
MNQEQVVLQDEYMTVYFRSKDENNDTTIVVIGEEESNGFYLDQEKIKELINHLQKQLV